MWEVLSTGEFNNWFETQSQPVQESVYASLLILREKGPFLGRPHVDTVEGSRHKNMKELRVQVKGQPYRIFFAFDKKRSAILLIGGNKRGDKRFYQRLIPVADRLFDEYRE